MVDFFDCVYPARNGRHGHAYTNHGKMNLLNAKYELDDRPLDETCDCPAMCKLIAERISAICLRQRKCLDFVLW